MKYCKCIVVSFFNVSMFFLLDGEDDGLIKQYFINDANYSNYRNGISLKK